MLNKLQALRTKNIGFLFLVVFLLSFGTLQLTGCAAFNHDANRTVGQKFDDYTLTRDVKSALTDESKQLNAVNVQSYKGLVQLSGFVDTKEQKNKAEDIAKDVKNVVSVKNDIVIKESKTNRIQRAWHDVKKS